MQRSELPYNRDQTLVERPRAGNGAARAGKGAPQRSGSPALERGECAHHRGRSASYPASGVRIVLEADIEARAELRTQLGQQREALVVPGLVVGRVVELVAEDLLIPEVVVALGPGP